jgi:hypothetical protein
VKGDQVYLGYESGHIVLFDQRSLSKQVTLLFSNGCYIFLYFGFLLFGLMKVSRLS